MPSSPYISCKTHPNAFKSTSEVGARAKIARARQPGLPGRGTSLREPGRSWRGGVGGLERKEDLERRALRRVGAAVEGRRAPLCNLCSSNPAHLLRADAQVEAIWYTRIPLFLHDREIQFCPISVLTHWCTRPAHMCVYPGPPWPSVLFVKARFCISGPTTALLVRVRAWEIPKCARL